jgi:endonuclease/exonuclease/phosphatase family metal-dependent hydrolase
METRGHDVETLRVATWNIRNGIAWDGLDSWPLRRRAVASELADLAADLVALQEVYGFQRSFLLRRLDGYAALGAGRRGDIVRGRLLGGEACLLLYRPARLRLDSWRTRWFATDPDVPGARDPDARLPRVATLAHFADRRSGLRFGAASVHLDDRSAAARERAAADLSSWLEPTLPWIVAGDLNEPPGGPAVARLIAGGLRDALSCGGETSGGASRTGLDGTAPPPDRIDHILTGPGFAVRAAWVRRFAPHGRRPSDHLPLVVELAMTGRDDRPPGSR